MLKISILLGFIQGLTEFLPVSSSGHLVLLEQIVHFKTPGLLFDVLVHFGTLGSVVYLFRKRIWGMLKSPFIGENNLKLLIFLMVATIPISLVGLLLGSWVEKLFDSVPVVGFSLLFTGGLLFLAERVEKKERNLDQMNLLDSISIGAMQALSLIPGISRSGATITTGVFKGINRKFAAEFSFILSVPAILGATCLKLWEAFRNPVAYRPFLGSYILGTIFAFITGIVAIKALLSLIHRRKLDLFAYYCWGVGAVALIYFYFLE